jgi:hypothetical protein
MKKKLLIIWNYLLEVQKGCIEVQSKMMFGKF